jgi:ABC-2 type transport system permease protein
LHDFGVALQSALAVFICGFIAFILLFPVSTAAVAERSIFNLAYTHEQLKFRFYDEDLSLIVTITVLAFAVALSASLFRFLRDKRASGAYLSLGISRKRLFAHRFIVGILFLFVALALPLFASFAFNVAALGYYDGELAAFAYVLCGYLVSGLVAFALASVACICAGTLFECGAFSLALLLGPSVVFWGLDALSAYFLVGSPFGKLPFGSDMPVAPSLLESASLFNPALFFDAAGAEHQLFRIAHPVYSPPPGDWVPVIGWVVFALVTSLFAAWLLRVRHGEQAQMAGMNLPLTFFSVGVMAFFVFSALFFVVAPVDARVALLFSAVAFVALSLGLLRGPLRGRTSPHYSFLVLGAECACVGACVLVIATGAFGFSSWVPAANTIVAAEISYVGTPSYLARPLVGTASGSAYYYHAAYRFEDAADVEVVRAAHERLIASARSPLALDGADFGATILRYDMVLRYTLADGSTRTRYFDCARVADLEALLVLDDSARMRARERAVITGDATELPEEEREALALSNAAFAYRAGALYVADPSYNAIVTLEVGEAARGELLRALAADVVAQSAFERYTQPEQPSAILMFTNSPQVDVASFGFSFADAVVPITPTFTRTRAWFEDNGLESFLARGIDATIIEQLSWLEDNPYASVVNSAAVVPTSRFFMGYRSEVPGRFYAAPDFGLPSTTHDSLRIAEAVPHLRSACFMGGGYLVEAKLRGVDVWVYYYLPAENAPSFMCVGT